MRRGEACSYYLQRNNCGSGPQSSYNEVTHFLLFCCQCPKIDTNKRKSNRIAILCSCYRFTFNTNAVTSGIQLHYYSVINEATLIARSRMSNQSAALDDMKPTPECLSWSRIGEESPYRPSRGARTLILPMHVRFTCRTFHTSCAFPSTISHHHRPSDRVSDESSQAVWRNIPVWCQRRHQIQYNIYLP